MGRYMDIARGVVTNRRSQRAVEFQDKIQNALDRDELHDLLMLADMASNAGDISRDEGQELLRLATDRSRLVSEDECR